eukprot:TRINITY_DN16482_c0_g1_i1.p1 TRINITY_DN16482_c0_g1~~TRINITY_DN16482_c0_g1_i1.p1  ORF type:complete len:104 (-),score=34.00 TRINITY_DN16482_c0_g1_i1:123-434(-)
MYIKSWDDFYAAAEKLYLSNPLKTRYVIKYRNVDRALVLKVTDDQVCVKFKTDQAQDAKKMEKLNNLFMKYMTSKEIVKIEEPTIASSSSTTLSSSPTTKGKK